METEEISFVIRCLLVIAVLGGVVVAVITYDALLEIPVFTNLLRWVGLS